MRAKSSIYHHTIKVNIWDDQLAKLRRQCQADPDSQAHSNLRGQENRTFSLSDHIAAYLKRPFEQGARLLHHRKGYEVIVVLLDTQELRTIMEHGGYEFEPAGWIAAKQTGKNVGSWGTENLIWIRRLGPGPIQIMFKEIEERLKQNG